jgi:primosomal protein N''
MAENLNLNVNVNTSGAEGSIGSLKKQLREAQNEVVALSDKFGATSQQAVIAAKKAAELRDRIGDAKALTDAFNPDAKFKSFSSSLSGVAGGFGAVQGAMALFGAETDNVQKTLLKVQSAMAISQGLQSVGESIDSFKQLGAVIKSTIVYQTAYNFIMGDTLKVTKEAVVEIEAQTIALEGEAVATTQVAVATTAATVAMRIFRAALIATGIGAAVVLIGTLVSYFTELSGATEKARKEKEKLDKAYIEGSKKAYSQYLDDFDSLKETELAKAGENESAKFKIEEEYRKKKIAALEQQSKELLGKDVEAEGEIQKQIAKLRNEGLINRYAEDRRLKKILDERKIQDAVDAALEEKQAIDNELAEYEKRKAKAKKLNTEIIGPDGLTDSERKKKAEDDLAYKEYFEKKNKENLEKSEKDGLGRLLAIKTEAYLKEWKLDKDVKDAQLKAEYELQDAKFSAVSAGLSLLGTLAGKSEAIANTLFIIDRALAIAQIVVNTQREIAAISAANAFLGVAGIPITASQTLAAKIRAGVGIATIAATSIAKFKNGSGSAGNSGGGGMPSVSSAAPMMPELPRAATTNISQQSINDIGNQAVRAYVVESDVTSNQQRIAAIRQRARFS